MPSQNSETEIKEKIDSKSALSSNDCVHSLRIDSLCAICGMEIEMDADLVPALHFTDRVFQTSKEARKLQKMKNKQLNKSKKMILILDLDQTIIHTTLYQIDCDFIFSLGSAVFYVKMRPYLNTFLKRISKLFEIHIYTMGTREYAVEICKFIDPDKAYFGDRIVSRSENLNEMKKSIERITCISKNVIILDDRADVWNYNKNLLLIRPFWYRNKIDINDPSKTPVYVDDIEENNEIFDLLPRETELNRKPELDQKPGLDRKPELDQQQDDNSSSVSSDQLHQELDQKVDQPQEIDQTEMKLDQVIPIINKVHSFLENTNMNKQVNDRELLHALKTLKHVHKQFFGVKKKVSRILKLRFLKNIKIASKIEYFSFIRFSGATVDLENPDFVLESPELAKNCKVRNISLKWLYECVYKRRLVPIDSYILGDYTVPDDYQSFLENEFFE